MSGASVISALVLPTPTEIAEMVAKTIVCSRATGGGVEDFQQQLVAYWKAELADVILEIYKGLQPENVPRIQLDGLSAGTVSVDPPTLDNEDDWRPVILYAMSDSTTVLGVEFTLEPGETQASFTITQLGGKSTPSEVIVGPNNHFQVNLGTNPGGQATITTDVKLIDLLEPHVSGIVSLNGISPDELPISMGTSVSFTLSGCQIRLASRQLYESPGDFFAYDESLKEIFRYAAIVLTLFGSDNYSPSQIEEAFDTGEFLPSSMLWIVGEAYQHCSGTFGVDVPIVYDGITQCSPFSDVMETINTVRDIIGAQGPPLYYRFPVDDVENEYYRQLIDWLRDRTENTMINMDDLAAVIQDMYIDCIMYVIAGCDVACSAAIKGAWIGMLNIMDESGLTMEWASALRGIVCRGLNGEKLGIFKMAWTTINIDSKLEDCECPYKIYIRNATDFVEAAEMFCGVIDVRRRRTRRTCTRGLL